MSAQPLYVYRRRDLFIDVESFSSVNLIKCGAYKYWESDDAEIILFAYAYDHEPTVVVDLLGDLEQVPQSVLDDITNPAVIKHAFNANFERLAIHKHFGIYCDPEQWRCTMVLGASLGLPGKLSQQAAVLKMPVQKKSEIGKDGIKFFCIPCKPTKKNGFRTRNYPHHDLAKWTGFKDYNRTDVDAERGLYWRLVKYDMQPRQWRAWAMDQRINDRGVMVDMQLVDNAIWMNDVVKTKLTAEAAAITGLGNPNSVQQLIKWLNDAEEEEDKIIATMDAEDANRRITDLRKKTVIALLGSDLTPAARRVLELRQMMAKASVAKYRAIQRSVCRDGRVRGLLQFYGAARTGRWAGRIVQMQNLPQNHLKDLALCREIVKRGDLATLEMLFGESVLIVLSELVRTAFVPAPDKRYIIVDFSAIEPRLAAWDSNEEWRLDVFRTHGLIYEASGAKMFNVPLKDMIKGGTRSEELRPKSKISELALQYQGGPNALITMGALDLGMQEEELLPIVRLWRDTNPAIRDNWYSTNDDAISAIKYKRTIKRQRYAFEFKSNTLFQHLPSGRKLCYPNARLEFDERFGKDAVVFDGVNQYTHQWGSIRTYGGKLFENRTQANGVDNLTNAMFQIEKSGLDIVFSVHDEPVLEVDKDWMAEPAEPDNPKNKKSKGVVYVEKIMCQAQPGFAGLPLAADGMDADFYQK